MHRTHADTRPASPSTYPPITPNTAARSGTAMRGTAPCTRGPGCCTRARKPTNTPSRAHLHGTGSPAPRWPSALPGHTYIFRICMFFRPDFNVFSCERCGFAGNALFQRLSTRGTLRTVPWAVAVGSKRVPSCWSCPTSRGYPNRSKPMLGWFGLHYSHCKSSATMPPPSRSVLIHAYAANSAASVASQPPGIARC